MNLRNVDLSKQHIKLPAILLCLVVIMFLGAVNGTSEDGNAQNLSAKWPTLPEPPINRRIVIGGDQNFPPFEYLDKNETHKTIQHQAES